MRLTLPRLAKALTPLPLLIACVTGAATGQSPNVITAPEVAHTRAATAYDAVRQIRPEMLRYRSPGTLQLFSTSEAGVAVDNNLLGGIEVLRGIPAADVARIEFLDSWQTAKKFGLESRDGIILVATRDSSGSQLSMTGSRSSR
jgi:hypothetical protein